MNDIKEYSEKLFDRIKHIDENGGIMPEKLQTPNKSLKQLDKEIKNDKNIIIK